jgi:arylsulfatase A-like enzyme
MMKRDKVIKWFGVAAMVGMAATSYAANTERPNILMLCVDDLNDWVGFLDGHPQTKTPHMDQLAAKGVVFEQAHCTAPACSPSRNAIMLGVEPFQSGLYPFYDINHLEPEVLAPYTALPLILRENGYTTVGLTKVFHNPDNTYRQDELWDEYEYYGNSKLNLLKDQGYYPDPPDKRFNAGPADNPPEDFQDRKSALHAVRVLERAHEKPFFLAVGFILPHVPLNAPLENFERFDFPIQAPEMLEDDLTDIPVAGQSNARIYFDYRLRKDNAWETYRRAYLASTSFTDDNIGLVLDALAKSPYADNTIVMLWSDHGFHLGEKRSHSKFSLWQEATQVPFIIWDPRNSAGNGQVCDEPVGLINVYRTLCDLAGITPPDYVDGISLRPWLENPSLPKESPALITWGRGNYSLRGKEWRYTRYFDGTEELYQVSEDPNEWTNLAQNPEYAAVKEEFAKWLPKEEAPQVVVGREFYDIADADAPEKKIQEFQKGLKFFVENGYTPLEGATEE